MSYLEKIKAELEKICVNVSIINDIKSLKFAISPSIYVMEISQTSQNFLNLATYRQQMQVRFAVIVAMKDLVANATEVEKIKKKVLSCLIGLVVEDRADISPICFYSGTNTEDKNLYSVKMEFGFSFVR